MCVCINETTNQHWLIRYHFFFRGENASVPTFLFAKSDGIQKYGCLVHFTINSKKRPVLLQFFFKYSTAHTFVFLKKKHGEFIDRISVLVCSSRDSKTSGHALVSTKVDPGAQPVWRYHGQSWPTLSPLKARTTSGSLRQREMDIRRMSILRPTPVGF